MRGGAMALGLVLSASTITIHARADEQIVRLPDEIEYKASLRPDAPPGVVLYGDVAKPGMYVTRSKFPMGFKVMPHWHGQERTVVVLSGTLYVGLGEKWDEGAMRAFPSGTFFTEPPNVPHFTWAKDGEVVIQVTGAGPLSTIPVPQKGAKPD
jgi:quercetin dioxygenase-like cupin family protein